MTGDSEAESPPAIMPVAAPDTKVRPVLLAFDLLGRRAALRILWSLRKGPMTFRALAAAADTNPATLSARLSELRTAGLIVHVGGYTLTASGTALIDLLKPLRPWAKRWVARQQKTAAAD